MIVFFAFTGVWQEFGMGSSPWLRYLSAIHTGRKLKGEIHAPSSLALQGFVVLMGLSLIATTVLGIVLAFKFGRGRITLASLIAGTVVPLLLILIFGR